MLETTNESYSQVIIMNNSGRGKGNLCSAKQSKRYCNDLWPGYRLQLHVRECVCLSAGVEKCIVEVAKVRRDEFEILSPVKGEGRSASTRLSYMMQVSPHS